MNPSAVARFLIPLVSFGLGAFTVAQCKKESLPHAQELSKRAAVRTEQHRGSPIEEIRRSRSSERMTGQPAGASPEVTITTTTLDAILSKGSLERTLPKMGLGEDEIKTVISIRAEAMEDFKTLENRHAKAVTKDGKSFIEIQAFPEEQEQWQQQLKTSLSSVLSEGQAEVISRLILSEDNDEQPGKYRREIHVRETTPDGRIRIEEQSFDEAGRHVDSDFEVITDRTKARWGGLLDF